MDAELDVPGWLIIAWTKGLNKATNKETQVIKSCRPTTCLNVMYKLQNKLHDEQVEEKKVV